MATRFHGYTSSAAVQKDSKCISHNILKPKHIRRAVITYSLTEEQADKLRALPLVSSAVGVAIVVGNKFLDNSHPALIASSSQSRADVATIVIAAVLGLTGLQWVSLKPKIPVTVDLEGELVHFMADTVQQTRIQTEITRFWEAVQTATKTTMMVVFWKGRCIAHLGYKAPGISSSSICMGELCNDSITRNVPRSLGNLALFPGRSEFLEYLPNNTQSLFVQPLHPDGVIVFGSATQRGFTILDQAWISSWSDKLFVTLEKSDSYT